MLVASRPHVETLTLPSILRLDVDTEADAMPAVNRVERGNENCRCKDERLH